MYKIIHLLLVIASALLMVSCQSQKKEEHSTDGGQTNIGKAAFFNMQLGLGYLKQGDRPRAKKKFLMALEQKPSSPEINAAFAYYLEQTNELERAKGYYLKAISLSANSGAQLNNYGAFLCRRGEYQQADSYFLKAIKDEQYVNTAAAYENAGLCALSIPNEKKAKEYFNDALSQDPSRVMALYELVKIESQQKNNDKALKLIQEHPDVVLHDKTFLELASNIATQAGFPELASEYQSTANKLTTLNDSGVKNE